MYKRQVSLRPSPLAFNPRPRCLSTPTDAFQLHPDVRSYGAKDYLVALGVALGCAAFATTGEESESSRNGARGATSGVAAWGPAYGVALMLAYLAVDGVRLLPIRPRSRGERHSLRTFPVVTLHPRFPFNV